MNTQNTYTSSIITKYGDIENVKSDVKTLRDILNRQGCSLLIDTMSEYVGETAIKFKMTEIESRRILDSLTSELKEAILERI